jgi:Ca2+-binding EF-hand superfamily protein
MHRRTMLAITAAIAAAGTTYAAENPGKIYDAMMPQTRADAQARVKAMFDRIDANHDGSITLAEFDAYRSARLAEWQAKRGERRDRAFAAMDTDQNGQVSKAEFDSFASSDKAQAMRHMVGARLVRARLGGGHWFDRADGNHDGRITLDEAQVSAMALFDAADADHNGTVTPEERRMAWAKARAARQQEN